MMGNTADIIAELKTDDKWKQTKVAVCSCTDEPDWADECMRLFQPAPGITLASVSPSLPRAPSPSLPPSLYAI